VIERDDEIARATRALKDIWPEQFEGVKTRAGIEWAELVAYTVRGAIRDVRRETALAIRDSARSEEDR
jgi:hypothetical protein